MKVLHITPAFYPAVGGIEAVVRDLAYHLRRQGIAADVLHVSPGNKTFRQDRVDESTVWRVPLFPNRLVGVTPPIRSLLMSYDLLHVHDPQAMALSANVIVQGRGRKMLLSTHGGYFHTNQHASAKKLHWKLFVGAVLKRYDRVLASSVSDREIFAGKAPHTKLVPNGVNVSKFLSIEHKTRWPATRWIYWGRLAKNKRLDLVIDAVKQARDAGLDADLTIAGQDFDGLAPALESQIAGRGLARHVRIRGLLSDAELAGELADRIVFMTASEYEGFGLSIAEALAAGLLVVCRNNSPQNDFIQPGENGAFLRFDAGPSDLATLRALCAAPAEEIAAMQTAARLSALPYRWEHAVKRYIAVYDDVMCS